MDKKPFTTWMKRGLVTFFVAGVLFAASTYAAELYLWHKGDYPGEMFKTLRITRHFSGSPEKIIKDNQLAQICRESKNSASVIWRNGRAYVRCGFADVYVISFSNIHSDRQQYQLKRA